MSLIATLVANPKSPVLSKQLANSIADAMDSRNLYWLASNIACDIVLNQNDAPASYEQKIRALIGELPVDVIIQEQDHRRKKGLIADMDSTMIEQECIDELAAEAGFMEKVSNITARAMNGEIPFEPALRERVALLKGLPVAVIDKVIKTRISLTPGGRELVATMNGNGAFTALVSGGFTHFTTKIAATLGFSENRANILEEQDGVLAGTVAEPILGREAKVSALNEFADHNNLAPFDFIAVGDGANDLGMLGLAGSGVALHAKPVVAKEAKFRVDHGDLTALLYIQGYRKSEFLT